MAKHARVCTEETPPTGKKGAEIKDREIVYKSDD